MVSGIDISRSWDDELVHGCRAMGLSLSDAQRLMMFDYAALLVRWNGVYNLTAVRDPALMVSRHLLDSLSILPWIDDGPVLDVGTGAGLPGIPLAIARPELTFSLLDSNGKKTRFVQQAIGELGLSNVSVIKARVQAVERPGQFARITTRAFATLTDMVAVSGHLLAPGGCWVAMKGASPDAEIRDLPPHCSARVEALNVPGEAGSRHVVILSRDDGRE